MAHCALLRNAMKALNPTLDRVLIKSRQVVGEEKFGHRRIGVQQIG